MTAAKEYTIPDLTYAGSEHAGKVMVDRVEYYAAMAREAKLSADLLQEQCRSGNYLAIANDRAKRISELQRRLDVACDLLHTASLALAGRLTFKESPRAEIIAFLGQGKMGESES